MMQEPRTQPGALWHGTPGHLLKAEGLGAEDLIRPAKLRRVAPIFDRVGYLDAIGATMELDQIGDTSEAEPLAGDR